jgi:hypothetical protein
MEKLAFSNFILAGIFDDLNLYKFGFDQFEEPWSSGSGRKLMTKRS